MFCQMNDETSVFMTTGRVKNDSWLFWSRRPNGLSWQQDRIWHHSLWIRMKEMEVILLARKPSWEEQLSPASVFLLAKVFRFEGKKEGIWEKTNKKKQSIVHLNESLSWVGWFCGQHCTGHRSSVRRRTRQETVLISCFQTRSAHSQAFFRHCTY